MRWDIDIGRIDVFHENSLMFMYQASPRIGHIEVLYHIFSYLKSYMKMGRIGYDSMGPNVDLSVINHDTDWMYFTGTLSNSYRQR